MITKKSLSNQIDTLTAKVNELAEDLPLTGGNRYAGELMTRAILNANLSQTTKNPLVPYSSFFQLLQISNYFAGLLPLDAEKSDNALLDKWYLIFQMAFIFGRVAVNVVGNKVLLYNITKLVKDDFDNITVLEGINLNNWDGSSFSGIEEFNNTYKAKRIEPNSTVIINGNINGWNAWITWAPFLDNLNEMLNRLDYVSIMTMKKLIIETISDNPEEVDAMVKQITSPNAYIVKHALITASGKLSNSRANISTLEVDVANLGDFINYIDWYINYFYTLLGKRLNNAKKRERNTQIESEAAHAAFDNLDNFHYCERVKLLKFLRKHGINGELVKLQNEEVLTNGDNVERLTGRREQNDNKNKR